MRSIIHVNAHRIRANLKHGRSDPPVRVQQGARVRYCMEARVEGPTRLVYSPDKPLKCGARVWIETEAPVTLYFRNSGGRCHWCGRETFLPGTPLARRHPGQMATRDHVRPQLFARGKDDPVLQPVNKVNACHDCNNVKGHHPHELFVCFLRETFGTPRFNKREFDRFVFACALAGYKAARRDARARKAAPKPAPKPVPPALPPALPPRGPDGRFLKRERPRCPTGATAC